MKLKMFKATAKTHSFALNQDVWIREVGTNHLVVYFKFRGEGEYVQGIIDRFHPSVGEIVEVDVEEQFANEVLGCA